MYTTPVYRTCTRCGDPLPSDRLCDCQGDPDRDYIEGLKGLKTNRVLTTEGMRKTKERER